MMPAKDQRFEFPGGRTLEIKELVTPEGTPIYVGIARLGDRMGALLLDILVICLWLIAVSLLVLAVASTLGSGAGSLALSFATVMGFFLRVFYFSWYELRRNGATIGKRRLGLRVVDAGGGQLGSEAIITRNLLREIEFWLPLQVLFGAETLFPQAEGATRLLAVVWVFLLALVPCFNVDRRRIGDFVAGTMVAVLPQSRLLGDLGRKAKLRRPGSSERVPTAFTNEQLAIYGIYELEVLEEVLRTKGKDRSKVLKTVARKIMDKIGWDHSQGSVEPQVFLEDFYRAQRKRLEGQMLMGERKERKSVEPGAPGEIRRRRPRR